MLAFERAWPQLKRALSAPASLGLHRDATLKLALEAAKRLATFRAVTDLSAAGAIFAAAALDGFDWSNAGSSLKNAFVECRSAAASMLVHNSQPAEAAHVLCSLLALAGAESPVSAIVLATLSRAMLRAGQSAAEARALLDRAEALRVRLHMSAAIFPGIFYELALTHEAFGDRASLIAARDLLVPCPSVHCAGAHRPFTSSARAGRRGGRPRQRGCGAGVQRPQPDLLQRPRLQPLGPCRWPAAGHVRVLPRDALLLA